MKEIILAKNAGFCFGVKRAVEEALKTQKEYNKKIYTLGPLIHNSDVVTMLEENNIFSIDISEIENLNKGDVVLIRSHGVSKSVFEKLKNKKINIINATCPYVSKIQNKAEKYKDLGYNIVILGDENHPEVIGINGWCDNTAIITKTGEFLERVPTKVCVLSQTTEKIENFQKTLSNLSLKSREILAFNTICSATSVRQESANTLSKEVDVMLIIGGKHSSNTTKLYQICKDNCENSYHIENLLDIKEFNEEVLKYKKIGVTAGASTPNYIIEEVINYLNKL